MARLQFIGAPSGGGATTVGPENVVFLEIGGDDATGLRGNAARPFATFAAALLAMQAGDEMRIGPGTFAVAASPAVVALSSFSIVGSGKRTTFLAGAAGVNVLRVGATATVMSIRDLTISSSAAGVPVAMDASAGGAPVTNSALLQDVRLSAAAGVDVLLLSSVLRAQLEDCDIEVGNVSYVNSNAEVISCTGIGATGDHLVSWTGGVSAPAARAGVNFRDVTCPGALSFPGAAGTNAPRAAVFPGCSFASCASANALGIVGAFAPVLEYHGRLFGAMTIVFPDSATVSSLDMSSGEYSGVITLSVTGAAANRVAVNARGIVHTSSAVGQINAGAGVDITLFTDNVNQGILATAGSGTITPSRWLSAAQVAITTPQALTFGFTAGSAPRGFSVVMDVQADSPCSITANSATGFTVTAAANGNAWIEARWA